MEHLRHILAQLDATCAAQGFAGWDPFDGLNSRLFRVLPLSRSRYARLAWLQLFKRSPINLRPLTLTPKTLNAKAISLFLRSAILQGNEAHMKRFFEMLMASRVPHETWGEAAWGYPFDWQAKAFFVPKDMPNVVCTAYAVRALRALQEVKPQWVDERLFSEAVGFVRRHLAKPEGYISYVPSGSALVYNASLWGAYVCLEGGERALAESAIANALDAQRGDGAWIYGTAPHHQFIDGFHTGYNLEALYLMNRHLQRSDIAEAIARGLHFYRSACFEKDGLAKYYAANRYPVDPHSAAQGIITLLTLDAPTYAQEAEHIAEAMIREMWDAKRGVFNYQKHQFYTNRITYMRWTQAWMHLALTTICTRG